MKPPKLQLLYTSSDLLAPTAVVFPLTTTKYMGVRWESAIMVMAYDRLNDLIAGFSGPAPLLQRLC